MCKTRRAKKSKRRRREQERMKDILESKRKIDKIWTMGAIMRKKWERRR